MEDAGGNAAEELERDRVLRVQAEELFRIAAIVRTQAQNLKDQADRSARILAANTAGKSSELQTSSSVEPEVSVEVEDRRS